MTSKFTTCAMALLLVLLTQNQAFAEDENDKNRAFPLKWTDVFTSNPYVLAFKIMFRENTVTSNKRELEDLRQFYEKEKAEKEAAEKSRIDAEQKAKEAAEKSRIDAEQKAKAAAEKALQESKMEHELKQIKMEHATKEQIENEKKALGSAW